jgi:deoxyribonuclease-4
MLLGIHVSKTNDILGHKATDDISDAIKRDCKQLGINCAQIFTHGPQGHAAVKINYEELIKKTSDINLTVHSSYPTIGIWKVKPNNMHEFLSKRAIGSIKSQLSACKKAGAWGLVVHISKILPQDAADTINAIKSIVKKSGVKLVLEMVSSKSDENKTYETPEKINRLTELLGPDENWWGWCVDTAHLWGAGVDIQTYDNMKKWLDGIKHKEKILLFHLNGSSAIRASGQDIHEIVFGAKDSIWREIDPYNSGARAVVEYAKKYELPIICEINRGSVEDYIMSIEKLKELGSDA